MVIHSLADVSNWGGIAETPTNIATLVGGGVALCAMKALLVSF